MTLTVAFQMDPIGGVDIDADSSFALALEAQARGYALLHYGPTDLSYRNGAVTARIQAMSLKREPGAHVDFGAPEVVDLAEADVVMMRQDPPFDMQYVAATHLLDRIHPATLVVNDPTEVRNAPEKLFVTRFSALMPPTLITHDRLEIEAFRAEYKDIVLKPLFGNGGAGVIHLDPADDNLGSLLDMYAAMSREPIMVQQYIAAVRAGDKRIVLIDGEPGGAINRIPAQGDARANMHAGGKAAKDGLTARDREICEAIGPILREKGQIFVGIDVIDGHLTEINVTSPTGIQEIDRFDGCNLSARIWDAIEARIDVRRCMA